VRSLVKERSSVGIEADVEIQKLAEDRAQSIGVKKTPSPLLESLLVAKTRYAGAMMRLVRSHKNVAHEALQNVEQTRKEEVQRQQLKLNQNQYLSRETKLLLAQKDTVHLAQQEFQSFFRRPFTKEQVAKEMSGQKALGLGH
jgi:tRNA splicing endonuclease